MLRFYSDDFGYNEFIDRKLIKLLEFNRIKGLSILANLVSITSLNQLKQILDNKKNKSIGLHVNLIEGKSRAKNRLVDTVVNQFGFYYSLPIFTIRLFLGLLDTLHIEKEIESQIRFVQTNKIRVTAIDSHQHIHTLSPAAEIVYKIAIKYNLQVRSYRKIKLYTLRAKCIHALLKCVAFVSYLICYKKFGLPITWRIPSHNSLVFMSWENNTFDLGKIQNRNTYIIHPFLPFDRNRSYCYVINNLN